ncbi:unnamed protein product [Arabidopsis thaliana]|uniref:(thale cress) hypothetical protein n=1 Tax=Arabidopsis thaliana TaxID=3702 RepID=A0A7G2EU01_ARATH|nr:unnamed protein product [Arabidopsis thaliana]
MNRRNRGSSSSSSSRVSNTYGNRQFSDNPRTGSGGGVNESFQRRSDAPHKRNNEKDESKHKDEDPADVSFIVGTCSSMCPERERVTRERLRDLAVFERLYGNPSKSSTEIAVKKNPFSGGCSGIGCKTAPSFRRNPEIPSKFARLQGAPV